MVTSEGFVDWAEEAPIEGFSTADKDPNYTFFGGEKKITLLSRLESDPSWGADNPPPHFTMWVGSESFMPQQHVSLYVPAYALGSTLLEANPNSRAGTNIQVCIMGVPKTAGFWNDQRIDQLAEVLAKIRPIVGIPLSVPWEFRADFLNPDLGRKGMGEYRYINGVIGIQHAPFDDGRWGPGRVLRAKLLAGLEKYEAIEEQEADSPDAIAEQGAADSGTSTSNYEDFDMSTKPFRFNPPLHRDLLPKRVDFASDDPVGFMRSTYLDETGYVAGTDAVPLQNYRLGRIFQHERAAGLAAVNESRYGFRFLYNPASVTTSSSRSDSVIIDPQSAIAAVISGINQNFQTVRFKLLINRTADVRAGSSLSSADYLPGISQEDVDGIRRYGTHWDLEILYRACNGIFNMEDRGKSADIGVIVPSNLRLILGPGVNHFGFLESIQYTDQLFSETMIPTLTDVEVVFRRHVDMTPEALAEFNATLTGTGIGGTSTADTDNATDVASGGPTTSSTPSGLGEGRLTQTTLSAMRVTWSKWGAPGTNQITTIGGFRVDKDGEHPLGRAIDIMVRNWGAHNGVTAGTEIADWYMKNHQSLRVMYVIWRQKIWNPGRDSLGTWPTNWRAMEDRGSPTHNHLDHIHVSFLPEA